MERGEVAREMEGRDSKVPILMKGQGERLEEYRGITIMPTLCKVYAAILTEGSVRFGGQEGVSEGNEGKRDKGGFN